MATLTFATDLETVTCASCGMTFAAPVRWIRARREKHDDFYCPAGHSLHFPGKSEVEKLRDLVAREKHGREQAEARANDLSNTVAHERRRVNGYRGQLARTKRRITKGECLHCSATFPDLAAHMQEAHAGELAAIGEGLVTTTRPAD